MSVSIIKSFDTLAVERARALIQLEIDFVRASMKTASGTRLARLRLTVQYLRHAMAALV